MAPEKRTRSEKNTENLLKDIRTLMYLNLAEQLVTNNILADFTCVDSVKVAREGYMKDLGEIIVKAFKR
jgi:hypothetical protein